MRFGGTQRQAECLLAFRSADRDPDGEYTEDATLGGMMVAHLIDVADWFYRSYSR